MIPVTFVKTTLNGTDLLKHYTAIFQEMTPHPVSITEMKNKNHKSLVVTQGWKQQLCSKGYSFSVTQGFYLQ